MTFKILERVIENKKEKGICDDTFKEDILDKMDVFLVAKRLSESEYLILIDMIK